LIAGIVVVVVAVDAVVSALALIESDFALSPLLLQAAKKKIEVTKRIFFIIIDFCLLIKK